MDDVLSDDKTLARLYALRDQEEKLPDEDRQWVRDSIEKLEQKLDEGLDRLQSEAIAWLEEKWGDRACPYCDAKSWLISPPMKVEYRPATAASLPPTFPATCGNCGQVVLVNAVVAGLLQGSDDDDVEGDEVETESSDASDGSGGSSD